VLWLALVFTSLSYGANTHIYWVDSTDDGVFRAETDGSNSSKIISEPSGFYSGIMVNPNLNKIYWTKAGDGDAAVREASLTGLVASDLVPGASAGTISTDSISYNPVNNDVFWGGWTRLRSVESDGSNVTLLDPFLGSTYATSAAVDATNGLLYWRDSSNIRTIDLTGGNNTVVLNVGSGLQSVALDVAGGKMYYANNTTDTISRANLDGSSAETLITFSGTDNPKDIALDLDNNKIYYLLDGPDSIGSANLDGSSSALIAGLTNLDNPQALALGPIPEPSTYALILGGLALVISVVIRRRRLAQVSE